MADFVDLCKVIIEKGGFKTFLFSVAVAIVSYKLWLNDWLWSVVVFCGCFLLVSLLAWAKSRHISSVYEAKKKKQEEEEKAAQYKRLCVVYDSLDKMTKQRLIELYKLPQQTYSNVRILNNMPYQQPILQVCCDMLHKYQAIAVDEGLGSYIITIDSEFYKILEKHAADFE